MSPSREEDPAFADLFDELLQLLLDGGEPDLDRIRSERPTVAARVDEAWSMACAVAGRRQPVAPTLGGYEILRELGRGGMGTVYLARHEALGREVALKVLPTSLGLSPRSRRRFFEEARALARLQHDHIVRIHRVVEHGDLLAFEMEFVDGPSLRGVLDHLRSKGPGANLDDVAQVLLVPTSTLGARNLVEWLVRIGSQIARALHSAHEAGIVHRDVKPANLLLRRDGKPLLADFGLARGDDPGLTHSGAFVGTPTYAPPEQLRAGDEAVDARADVYSLGVTLYEAIALTPPFAGRTTTEMLRSIEEGHAAPLRRRAPHVQRDLETILAKAMERAPKDRYASAAEFADDLDRLLQLQPIRARPAGLWRSAAKFARRNRRTLLAAAAGALLVGIATLPVFQQLQAAESARIDAARLVAEARMQVLATASQLSGWQPFPGSRGPVYHGTREGDPAGEALVRAVHAYDAGLATGTLDGGVRAERDVVRLALWLHTRAPTRAEQVEAALQGREFANATANMPELVVRAARGLAAGQELDEVATAVPQAGAIERTQLGLLCFLVGEYRLCERSWSDLGAAATAFPLLDAGLGTLYLADGRPERAYVRLLHGTRTFPETDELSLVLADAALAMNDPPLARQWLAKVHDTETKSTRRLLRVRADLAAADGDAISARKVYERLAGEDPTDPLPRYRLAQSFAAAGELLAARTQLHGLLADWPEVARFRLETARLALQMEDAPLYLAQARYVLRCDFGAGRSAGAVSDLLEILHLGGLDGLCAKGLARNGSAMVHRDAFALRRPVARMLPPALRPRLEELLQAVARIERELLAQSRGPHGRFASASAAWCAVTRHLPASLDWLPLASRLALHGVSALLAGDQGDQFEINATRFLRRTMPPSTAPSMQPLRLGDADPELVFGCAFERAGDIDGDGDDDFLVGSAPTQSGGVQGKVEMISGRTGHVLATLTARTPDRLFGFAATTVGDVDGDRVADWLVGAPQGGRGGTRQGGAYLFSGRDGSLLRSIDGDEAGFGVSLAGVGDVDGDGVADYAIGVTPELHNRTAVGEVRVYSGKDGAPLRTLRSDRAGVWFGGAIANVGDVDGDGCPDLAVGGNYGQAAGLVRVFSGRTGGVCHTWLDEAQDSMFGEVVAAAGDVDGDGHADVAVAAPGAIDAATGGRVSVFSGADGHLLHVVRGEGPGDRFGQSLFGAGDLDGDGRADLVIGAGRGGKANSGFVVVAAGHDGSTRLVCTNTTPNSSFASRLAIAAAARGGMRIAICNGCGRGLGSIVLAELPAVPPATQPR